METVTLKPLYHRGQESIGIYYDNNASLNKIVRKLPQVKWSQTNRCWYVPLNKEIYTRLFFALKGKAEIEQTMLHQYLADKKKNDGSIKHLTRSSVKPAGTIKSEIIPAKQNASTNQKGIEKILTINKTGEIQPINAHVLPAMRQKLKLKAYSPSTIKTYNNEMGQLLQTIKNIPAEELTPEHFEMIIQMGFKEGFTMTLNELENLLSTLNK